MLELIKVKADWFQIKVGPCTIHATKLDTILHLEALGCNKWDIQESVAHIETRQLSRALLSGEGVFRGMGHVDN